MSNALVVLILSATSAWLLSYAIDCTGLLREEEQDALRGPMADGYRGLTQQPHFIAMTDALLGARSIKFGTSKGRSAVLLT